MIASKRPTKTNCLSLGRFTTGTLIESKLLGSDDKMFSFEYNPPTHNLHTITSLRILTY